MKKNIFLFLAAISVFSFIGCEENLEAEVSNMNYVSFAKTDVQLDVNKDGSNTVSYDVYSSTVSGSDRTLTIEVDENLTNAGSAAYTVPASVTIPANSNKGSFDVSVEDIDIIDTKNLVLNIKEEENLVSFEKMTVKIVRICEFDITALYGTYSVVEDDLYNYDVTVTAGPAANTLTITNLYDYAGSTVIGLNNTTGAVTFRSIEFDAVLYVHPTYGNLYANTLEDTPASSFSVCENTMNLNFIRTVDAGNFTTVINTKLTKQ